MSQVIGDAYWLDAKKFVQQHWQKGDRILAPSGFFRSEFDSTGNFYPYDYSYLAEVEGLNWVVVHKGMIDSLQVIFLQKVLEKLLPIFANEVFVIFARSTPLLATLSMIDPTAPHFQSLLIQIDIPPSLQPRYGIRSQPLTRKVQLKQSLAFLNLEILLRPIAAISARLQRLEKQVKQLEKVNQHKFLVLDGQAIAPLSLSTFVNLCRSSSQTTYLGNQTLLCRVLGRYLMYGDSRDIGIVPHLCMDGYWEPNITLAVARVLQSDWHCLDVGANHGYYALLMASVVKTRGRVVAIEPNPKLVQLIHQTMDVNGFTDCVQILPQAVSDSDGKTVQLTIPAGYTGNASIAFNYGQDETSSTHETFAVETVSIDRLTQDWQRVDLIKVDVEGAELETWRGMQATIQKHNNIILLLEFGAARYPNARQFLEEIQAAGFILRHVANTGELEERSIDQYLSDRPDSHWDLFLMRK